MLGEPDSCLQHNDLLERHRAIDIVFTLVRLSTLSLITQTN